jgi:death on curing protein
VVRYLTADQVIQLHDLEERAGLRDRSLLESAVGAPQHTFDGVDLWQSIHEKAAALMRSLSQNQAFVDGNKRTALLAVAVFYSFNGYEFRPPTDAEVVHLLVDLAIDHVEVPKVAEQLEHWATEIPDPPPEAV